MNWKNLSIATLFAALSLAGVSAQAQDSLKVEHYMYGSSLDIQHVVASASDSGTGCGISNKQLTYLDSHDQRHVLGYQAIGQNCSNDN